MLYFFTSSLFHLSKICFHLGYFFFSDFLVVVAMVAFFIQQVVTGFAGMQGFMLGVNQPFAAPCFFPAIFAFAVHFVPLFVCVHG